jgi:hypothetical protein
MVAVKEPTLRFTASESGLIPLLALPRVKLEFKLKRSMLKPNAISRLEQWAAGECGHASRRHCSCGRDLEQHRVAVPCPLPRQHRPRGHKFSLQLNAPDL